MLYNYVTSDFAESIKKYSFHNAICLLIAHLIR